MASDSAPDNKTASPTRRRWLAFSILLIGGLLAALIGAGSWILHSEQGARTALSLAERLSGGLLKAEGIDGRFSDTLRVTRLQIALENQTITLDRLTLSMQPSALLQGRLHITSLSIDKLGISSKIEQKSEPATLPASIALPVKLKIDSLQVNGGELAWGPLNIITLGAFALHLDYDGQRYALNLDEFNARSDSGNNILSGNLQGQLSLSTARPYALDAALQVDSENIIGERTIVAKSDIKAQGSLEQFTTALDLRIDQAHVNGHIDLRPFGPQVLGAADLKADSLDLALLADGMPHTALDIQLHADDKGKGKLTLNNPAAGLYNEGSAPLSHLLVEFSQHDNGIDFERILATLGSARRPAGNIDGSGKLKDGALDMTLAIRALDLQKIDSGIRQSRLDGSLTIQHVAGRQEFMLAMREPLKTNALTLTAHAVIADDVVVIDKAELRAGNSAIDLKARVGLRDAQTFEASAAIRAFDPRNLGNFASMPRLLLNGDVSINGKRHPALEADAAFQIKDSRIENQPLQGAGNINLRAETLHVPALTLQAGNNRLSAQGRLAEQNSRITFAIDAPALAQLGNGLSGTLKLDGEVHGSVQQPRMTANWNGDKIHLPGNVQIATAQGTLTLDLDRRTNAALIAGMTLDAKTEGLRNATQQITHLLTQLQFGSAATAPLQINILGTGINGQQLDVERFEIKGNGSTAQHALSADLIEREQQWHMTANGSLQNLQRAPLWQGTLSTLDASGRLNAKLAAAAPLKISASQVQLDQFRLGFGDGTIVIEQFLRNARGITTRGNISQLQLAGLLQYALPEAPFSTDMRVGGEWDLKMANRMDGYFKLRRESGDIAMRSNESARLGLSTLDLDASANAGRIALALLVEGSRPGRIDIRLDSTLGSGSNRMSLMPNTPLTGHARVNAPTLGWLGPLVSQTLITAGSLNADIALAGTVGNPRFSGNIQGDALRLQMTDTGIDLRNGTLRSHFQDDQLVIDTLNFRNGDGDLTVTGPLSMVREQLALDMTLKASRYLLIDRSDRKLVISGNSTFGWRDGKAKANGSFKVDSGMVDIGSSETPQLSDDVIIIGRNDKAGTKTAFSLDLLIALGDGVNLTGRGLDGKVVGDIRLLADAGSALRAEGTLRVASGTFKAYGRELAIEQGLLRFNGPLNNPNLDILAMRRGQEVEAGVSVRGTVMSPRITLVSDPAVADAEKLSWLVLGRGLSGAGSGDISALQSAASSLLTQGAATGLSAQLATAFGLDDFSIGTSDDSLQERIVTIGKRISSRLYVSYKQGLESASSVLLLRYTLTPRLTVEGEAGTSSALSLFYNFAFD